jgi:RimJ/RimL family protein N-acetyltransferase
VNLVFGDDKTIADWASKRFGKPMRDWHYAIGIIDRSGLLVGAATFHDINGFNTELCFWGPGALSASVVRGLMRFAFRTLGLLRVTARTPRKNKIVTRGLPAFGFRCEGVAKHYYGPHKSHDAIVFGLLAADAEKFIGDRT